MTVRPHPSLLFPESFPIRLSDFSNIRDYLYGYS